MLTDVNIVLADNSIVNRTFKFRQTLAGGSSKQGCVYSLFLVKEESYFFLEQIVLIKAKNIMDLFFLDLDQGQLLFKLSKLPLGLKISFSPEIDTLYYRSIQGRLS